MKALMFASAAALLSTSSAQAQTIAGIEGEWRAFEVERSNLKLAEIGYFEGQAVHAEPYVTCNAGSGWVSITHEMRDDFDGKMRLRGGRTAIELPTVTREALGVTVEAMIPANHPILAEMLLGRTLQIGADLYPVETSEERSAIRDFLKRCQID